MSLHNRPLSPHIQVYKPQLTSVLSIFHRATGIVLSIGAILIALWLGAIAYSHEIYVSLHEILSSFIGIIFLLGWTIALFYHLCNGIRHLFWDVGKGMEIRAVYQSGWLVLVATVVLTVIVWTVGYFACGW